MTVLDKAERPPRGRIPSITAVVERCPWDMSAPAAYEQARRIATQVQAREYLLWLLERHPPNLSVAHGVSEVFWARDGVIIEEIVSGFARWELGLSVRGANSYKKTLDVVIAETGLPRPLIERMERARVGRNRATHGRKAPRVTTDYRRLTAATLRARLDAELIDDVTAALSNRR